MDRLSLFSFRRGLLSRADKEARGARGLSRVITSLVATVALVMVGMAVALASPGVASAVENNPTPNPTAPAISYEEDCTISLEAGNVAPFATALNGNTTVDNAAPTGATFGYTGTASTEIVGSFVAALYANSFGVNPLPLQWEETIGSTDGNATGSYAFTSPKLSVADGGGSVASVTWTKNSTTLTAVSGTFADAAVGDYVYSTAKGLPTGVQITAINGANATIGAATTAAGSKKLVGYGANTEFSTPITTGNVFTTAGSNGETAGVGVTSATEFVIDGFLTFGGATGQGASNCLQTGYTAAGTAGPGQGGGVTPPLETAPVFPNDTTTPLVSVSPLTFPSAAYVNLQSSASAPGAPTIGTATAGNASASVTFTPPTNDGGSPITGYTVTAADSTTPANGGQTAGGTASPITVMGLTNGDSYTFTVTATNAIGTGDPSGPSNAVTPEAPTAPGAPTIGTATAGNASATVKWTAPASNGGSPIIGYVITPSSGPAVTVGNVTSDDVTGLTNGTSYTFKVAATNAIGTGAASASSNAVTPEAPAPPPATPAGYWVVTADGGVYPQGSVSSHGSAASVDLNAPIVGSAALPGGSGYWLVGADGGIFSYGAAAFYGSMGGDHLNAPVVGMASTPDGKGYWLVAADGGVFAFGDAAFAGSAAQTHLNAPVVGIVGDGTTGGYWLVASDGGIFSYGNAHFHGSTGGDHLNAPIVGAAGSPGGNGYWLVGADGGVFAFGSAPFKGSAVGSTSGSPVVGISAATGGYVLTTADGGVFAYGAKFFGSEAGTTLGAPVVAVVN